MAEDGWNTRDPTRVALAYTIDTRWRNRVEFLHGRDEAQAFLARKWAKELDYRLIKELWAFESHRIAVRYAYEHHDDSGNWFRTYGQRDLGVRSGRPDAYSPRQCQRASDQRAHACFAGPPALGRKTIQT